MSDFSNLILRWCIGQQNTIKLSDFSTTTAYRRFVWLAKLSIRSFQNWFKDAEFVLLYNGFDFSEFCDLFESINVPLLKQCKIIDQRGKEFKNPYHFTPTDGGVWYKWIPFRLDTTKTEISIDTDIICINEPKSWYKWFDVPDPVLIARERFSEVVVNTCGDFYRHPVLKNKTPLNCGVVGHKAGYDFSTEFYQVTRVVRYGATHNSMFITEQGAINVWAYLLQLDGVEHFTLDFEKNAWMRDFLYYLEKGICVETIHATTWHKAMAQDLKYILEKKILSNAYPQIDFLHDIIAQAQNLEFSKKSVIAQQIGTDRHSREYYLQ